MPLLDHFREPLNARASWESFHTRWAVAIADYLDRTLPGRFYAKVNVHLGYQVATDVAEFDDLPEPQTNGSGGGLATLTYAPPAPPMVIPFKFTDELEIEVRDTDRGGRLAAVIELVSPANKDRPEKRRLFAAKCDAYLQTGVGLMIVDVVTTKNFNLHDQLIEIMSLSENFRMAGSPTMYAASYRPVSREKQPLIDAWLFALEIGHLIPSMPLPLRGVGCIKLDLEATYMDACQRIRLA